MLAQIMGCDTCKVVPFRHFLYGQQLELSRSCPLTCQNSSPCGHSFCIDCLLKLAGQNNQARRIVCRLCRRTVFGEGRCFQVEMALEVLTTSGFLSRPSGEPHRKPPPELVARLAEAAAKEAEKELRAIGSAEAFTLDPNIVYVSHAVDVDHRDGTYVPSSP